MPRLRKAKLCCLKVWPLAIRSLLLFIFGVLQRPLYFTCACLCCLKKKLFRIKVDDKKLKGKAPLFPTLKSLLLYIGKFTKMFIRLSLMKIFCIFSVHSVS